MTHVRDVRVVPVDMAPLELGEGARWFRSGPVQVDLLSGRLLALRDGRLDVLLDLGVPLGAAAPRSNGGLVAVAGTGVRLFASPSDDAPILIDTGADPRALRVNDATTDERGRLWFGLMPFDGTTDAGSLWRVTPDGGLQQVLGDISVPNGPVIDSARGVLYLADSAQGVIHRHELDPASGEIGPAETFATVADASPDGMALDAEGGLWSALWGGSRLHRYDTGGRLTDVVPLPVRQPTSIAINPSGGLALVTSAYYGLADPGRLDGLSLWVDLDAVAPRARDYGG